MKEQLFDCAAEYEAMLNRGISLSGEKQEFFIVGRTEDLRSQLPQPPRRILDFGCGTGRTCNHLARLFPNSTIVGADLSEEALQYARELHGSDRVTFTPIPELPGQQAFDLCYVNGVFHHIDPSERQTALGLIRAALAPGAHLAIFENNPWNPGTRAVMRRIPFDQNAITLSLLELRRRMKEAGFEVVTSRSLFYLPRPLAALRFMERFLVNVPLGAQYYVLGRVPCRAW